jgi:hypothetical protein
MKKILLSGLLSLVLTACASVYQQKGYSNEQDWQFAQKIQNSTPKRIETLKYYGVKSEDEFFKIIENMESEKYSNNPSWEAVFEYLKDKKEADTLGVTALALKEKRRAEEDAAYKVRLAKIIKKNDTSVLLTSKASDNEILIVDSEDLLKGKDLEGNTIEFTVQSQFIRPISFKGGSGAYAIVKGYIYCSDGSGQFTSIQVHSGDNVKSQKVYSQNISTKIGVNGNGEFMNQELKDLMCNEARRKRVLITAADIKSIKDMPVRKNFEFKDFPFNTKSEICTNITSVSSFSIQVVVGMKGRLFADMYRNGGGGWTGTYLDGNDCYVRVNIDGIYKGTSYKRKFNFKIKRIVKGESGKFIVTDLVPLPF